MFMFLAFIAVKRSESRLTQNIGHLKSSYYIINVITTGIIAVVYGMLLICLWCCA